MNLYIFPTTCDVCGEEGMLHARDIGKDWMHGAIHRDPRVCADNLRYQRQRLEQAKKDFVEIAKPIIMPEQESN